MAGHPANSRRSLVTEAVCKLPCRQKLRRGAAGRDIRRPFRMCRLVPQIVVVSILTMTSVGFWIRGSVPRGTGDA
jgi:hypothetical protein